MIGQMVGHRMAEGWWLAIAWPTMHGQRLVVGHRMANYAWPTMFFGFQVN